MTRQSSRFDSAWESSPNQESINRSRYDPAWAPRSLTYEICLTCAGFWSSGFGLFAARAAQAVAGEFDAMGVVDEAVEDGVGVGGVADDVVPGGHGKLGGDDRRSTPVAFFEDFEQVVAGAGVERLEAEVVEDEEIGATEGFQKAGMAPSPRASASSSKSLGQR